MVLLEVRVFTSRGFPSPSGLKRSAYYQINGDHNANA